MGSFWVESSFGQAKQTVPNSVAVPVALTRKRIRREYLSVFGEAAHGGVGRVLAGCRVEGGVGFDVAALGGRFAAWGELAAPIASDHDRDTA